MRGCFFLCTPWISESNGSVAFSPCSWMTLPVYLYSALPHWSSCHLLPFVISCDLLVTPLYLSAFGIWSPLVLTTSSHFSLWIISLLCEVPTSTWPQSLLTPKFPWPSIPFHFSNPHPQLPSRLCHNSKPLHVSNQMLSPFHIHSPLTPWPFYSSDYIETAPGDLPSLPVHCPNSCPPSTARGWGESSCN